MPKHSRSQTYKGHPDEKRLHLKHKDPPSSEGTLKESPFFPPSFHAVRETQSVAEVPKGGLKSGGVLESW